MNKTVKRILKICGVVLGVVILIVGAYLAYAFIDYHRIEDNEELTVDASVSGKDGGEVTTDIEYSIMTYNIGFGAYVPSYSFFMDGGKYSRAYSEDSVKEATATALDNVTAKDPDFVMFEEVDLDSTRSYHVNQYELIRETLADYQSADAIDYDSPYLMYPLYKPHGKSLSSLALFSKYTITSSLRRSLPIESGFKKMLDLDRCYSVSRIPVDNGKELVIITVHLSAYSDSSEVRSGQVNMLVEEMQKEKDAGNYVICGGDFNHDLKADSDTDESQIKSWAYPFPREELPEGFEFAMDKLPADEKANLWNSARDADIPYDAEKSFTVTLDGFIISDNITMTSYENINTGYSASDHDPVYMTFKLN